MYRCAVQIGEPNPDSDRGLHFSVGDSWRAPSHGVPKCVLACAAVALGGVYEQVLRGEGLGFIPFSFTAQTDEED